jgi:hypothetical protein
MKTIEICGTTIEVADNAKLNNYQYRQSIENLFNDVSCLPGVIRLDNEVHISRNKTDDIIKYRVKKDLESFIAIPDDEGMHFKNEILYDIKIYISKKKLKPAIQFSAIMCNRSGSLSQVFGNTKYGSNYEWPLIDLENDEDLIDTPKLRKLFADFMAECETEIKTTWNKSLKANMSLSIDLSDYAQHVREIIDSYTDKLKVDLQINHAIANMEIYYTRQYSVTGVVRHAIYFKHQKDKWYITYASDGFEFITNIFGFKFDNDEMYEIKKMDIFLNMIGEQYQREEKLRESFNKTRDIIVGKTVKK